MGSPTLEVVARRPYRASRATVFRAFTEPEYLTGWFSPSSDISLEVLDFTLREGGKYRFGFRFPDGQKNFVVGEYREISRPSKLVFTWTWEAPDPHAGIETIVTVELLEHGEETEVVVHHARFPNEETCHRHEQGWNGALERLHDFLQTLEVNRGSMK
jgi:uncharacterized protein YndB with AHSA1/START domain